MRIGFVACLTNTKARCLHPVVWYPEDELPIILDKSYQDWQTSAFYVRDASEAEEEYAHNELVNMACEAAEFQPVIKPQRARKPTIRAVQKMTVEEARRACDGCCMEGDKAKKDLDALSKKVEKGTLAAKGKNAESKATSKADAAVLKTLTSENSNLKKEVAKLQEELRSAEISSMASEKALNLLTNFHSMQPPRQRMSDSQYRSNSGSEFSRGGDRNRHDKSQRRDHDPADRAERTPRRISPRRSPPTRASPPYSKRQKLSKRRESIDDQDRPRQRENLREPEGRKKKNFNNNQRHEHDVDDYRDSERRRFDYDDGEYEDYSE